MSSNESKPGEGKKPVKFEDLSEDQAYDIYTMWKSGYRGDACGVSYEDAMKYLEMGMITNLEKPANPDAVQDAEYSFEMTARGEAIARIYANRYL